MTYSDKIYWRGYDEYDQENPYEEEIERALWEEGKRKRKEEMEDMFV